MPHWRLRDARRIGALVSQALSQSWRSSPGALNLSAADWALAAPVLLDSPAAPLLWKKLSPEQPFFEQFHNAYRFSGIYSEMRALDLHSVLAKLRNAGVEPIVHKGWATARLYPEPALRSYSDIDLLIRPDQIDIARHALALSPPVNTHVDLLHSELHQLDSVSFETLYTRSLQVDFASDFVRILSPEDHLRSLCIHCLKHGVASPLWLVDVAVAIESATAAFNWDLCIGKRQPQANWVRSALSLAHRLLQADLRNTPIPQFVHELPGWLVRSVSRRWSRPPVPSPLPHFATVLQRRTGITEALAWRWPSAAQSTIDANATFTRIPNLHLQLRFLFQATQLKPFLSELLWRRQDPPKN